VHLFDIDVPGKIRFQESEVLTGGESLTDFDSEYGKIGVAICYDVRFPEMAMVAARRGSVAMIYPGAFNLTTGPLHWELLARARAVDNQIYVAMCSPARDMNASYNAWGHSTIVDPNGEIIAKAGEGEEIIYADLSKIHGIHLNLILRTRENARSSKFNPCNNTAKVKPPFTMFLTPQIRCVR